MQEQGPKETGQVPPHNHFTELGQLNQHLLGLGHERVQIIGPSRVRIQSPEGGALVELGPIGDIMDFYVIEPIQDTENRPKSERMAHYVVDQTGEIIQGGAAGTSDSDRDGDRVFDTSYPSMEEALQNARKIIQEQGIPLA